MMKSMTTLLMLVLMGWSIEFTGYQNRELEGLSFTDSLMVTSIFRVRGLPDGWRSGGSSGNEDTIPDSTTTPLSYHYDSLNNRITSASADTFFLDDQKRVIRIQEGYIKTTHIRYGTDQRTIIVHPNEDTLTRHSTQWVYTYRPDGQVQQMIKIPNDWEYPGTVISWGTDYADTLTYTYDAENRKTGAFYIVWERDFNHSFPWKRRVDSLSYTYAAQGDSTTQTITLLSQVGTEWKTMANDTQWINTYDKSNRLLHQRISRWDANNQEWDNSFFQIVEYTYKDSLLVKKTQDQYYGTGTTVLREWYEEWTYGKNTLVYPPVTPLGKPLQHGACANVKLSFVGRTTLTVVGPNEAYDHLALYTLSGRKIREVAHGASLSLMGVASSQPLLFVASKKGAPVLTTKIMLP